MKNVLLVFGGKSYEHDISVVTAMQIYKKARLKDINLVLFYVSRQDEFFVCDSKKTKLVDFSLKNFNKKNKAFKEVCFVSNEKKKLFLKTRFGLKEFLTCDSAIIACHGGDGENGRLVTFLEKQGIVCSAGNSEALSFCMDKFMFKSLMRGLKLPIVSGFCISKDDYLNEKAKLEDYFKFYKFPLVIKANSGGSSIGVFIVEDIDDFNDKIKQAFEFDDKVVVEKYIKNSREFNVAVIGDKDKVQVSEVDEPLKNNEILTFADKYLSQGTKGEKCKGGMENSRKNFPAQISSELSIKLKDLALKVFKGLGLKGIVRIDFLYDETKNKIYICEVNAVPGSLAYYFFAKNKIVTNPLIERLVEIAHSEDFKCDIHSDYVTDILSTD